MPVPFCSGNDQEHCCWIDGVECEFLVENDPRVTRRWACGLFLQLLDQFPNKTPEWIWGKVQAHPGYARIGDYLQQKGQDHCGNWRGYKSPDGSVRGQCCYKGWEWDSNGNVVTQP